MSPIPNQDYLILVIGAPGSGKGTLCSRLALENDFVHLSVGDILRQAVRNNSCLVDDTIVECMQAAELIPADALANVLAKHVGAGKENRQYSFLIDGFPRDTGQIDTVEQVLGEPKLVLYFDCPGSEAKRRYLTRKLEGRDENEAVFEKRFQEFQQKNGQIVEHYAKQGKLIKIDTSTSTELSYARLVQVLSQREEWQDVYLR
ncbi:hypothetical protein B9Z65_4045 [Elsinoe australis]|uniref:Adenylate kinase n=1 Tax=Elsinoe australis TaxID=40998 RepID=A0A2P7Z1R1_9PEZI|nr:hypothetical protein B9Z65_4045 [Elsinoe australis]